MEDLPAQDIRPVSEPDIYHITFGIERRVLVQHIDEVGELFIGFKCENPVRSIAKVFFYKNALLLTTDFLAQTRFNLIEYYMFEETERIRKSYQEIARLEALGDVSTPVYRKELERYSENYIGLLINTVDNQDLVNFKGIVDAIMGEGSHKVLVRSLQKGRVDTWLRLYAAKLTADTDEPSKLCLQVFADSVWKP